MNRLISLGLMTIELMMVSGTISPYYHYNNDVNKLPNPLLVEYGHKRYYNPNLDRGITPGFYPDWNSLPMKSNAKLRGDLEQFQNQRMLYSAKKDFLHKIDIDSKTKVMLHIEKEGFSVSNEVYTTDPVPCPVKGCHVRGIFHIDPPINTSLDSDTLYDLTGLIADFPDTTVKFEHNNNSDISYTLWFQPVYWIIEGEILYFNQDNHLKFPPIPVYFKFLIPYHNSIMGYYGFD